MSRWARETIGCSLVGHMFAKLDRATAEQGVEARCPLLDYDLVQYARKLSPELLLHGGKTKALLKAQLHGWPDSFVHRPKLGFAFRLRWTWALSLTRGSATCSTRRRSLRSRPGCLRSCAARLRSGTPSQSRVTSRPSGICWPSISSRAE